MALDGRFRPVVEFMYADFMWVAADQIFNQIAKARHMFGGDRRRPARAAQQARGGHRLRLPALDGPGRRPRHRAGPAHRRPVDPVRLRRADEHRAGLRRPCPRARARRPLRRRPARGPSTTSTTASRWARPRCAAPGTTSRSSPTSRWSATARGAATVPEVDADLIDLRWLDRACLDWDTIERASEDQPRAHRRAGRRRHVLRRLAGRRDPAPALRLARRPDRASDRRRRLPSISKVLERAAIARTEEVVAALRTFVSP